MAFGGHRVGSGSGSSAEADGAVLRRVVDRAVIEGCRV